MKCYPITVVKRRGFTALELIIVLVVGFSIIALSASKMGQLFSASTTAEAMGSLLELYTSARLLRGSDNYGGKGDDLGAALEKANMLPKNLKGQLKNEWGGGINIESYNEDNVVGFDITYEKVPGEACAKIAQSLLRSGNFAAIHIGDGKNDFTSSTSPADVVMACAETEVTSGGKKSKEYPTMIFKFRE